MWLQIRTANQSQKRLPSPSFQNKKSWKIGKLLSGSRKISKMKQHQEIQRKCPKAKFPSKLNKEIQKLMTTKENRTGQKH